jgi:hypothetical protein
MFHLSLAFGSLYAKEHPSSILIINILSAKREIGLLVIYDSDSGVNGGRKMKQMAVEK